MGKALFAYHLWDMVNNERYASCIHWSEDGQNVFLDKENFLSRATEPNHPFFGMKKQSLLRQLNCYGFKVCARNYYTHQQFKRGCEHLIKEMKPKKKSCKRTTGALSSTSGPTTGASPSGEPSQVDQMDQMDWQQQPNMDLQRDINFDWQQQPDMDWQQQQPGNNAANDNHDRPTQSPDSQQPQPYVNPTVRLVNPVAGRSSDHARIYESYYHRDIHEPSSDSGSLAEPDLAQL